MAEPFVLFRCQPSAATGTCDLERAADEDLSVQVASALEAMISNTLWPIRAEPMVVVVGAPVAVARPARLPPRPAARHPGDL